MSRRLARLLLPAGLLLLAGCASAEDFRRADAAACTGYGFKQGTDQFAACLQREALARRYGPLPGGPFAWYGAGFYAGPPWW